MSASTAAPRIAGPSGPSKQLMPSLPSDNKPLTDLTIYTVAQLGEMRDRQMHLLANKKRLATLPDKGVRIRALHQRVCDELSTRDAVQQASELFSALNLAATGKRLTTQMEWNGRMGGGAPAGPEAGTDADAADAERSAEADERNPLKLLAQSRQTAKIVKVEAPEESLITAADREQIAEFEAEKASDSTDKVEPAELEPHAVYMCSIDERHEKKRERFLPHKTIIASTSPGGKSPRPLGKHWENTAATFPVLRNQAVVALTLQDSIEIQRKQYEALKSVELQNATERLKAHELLVAKLQAERSQLDDAGRLPSSLFGTYRQSSAAAAAGHSSDDDDDGNSDSDAEDRGRHAHSGDEHEDH